MWNGFGREASVRQIEIEDGLRLRFPERSAEFDEGVEVGVAAVLMAISAKPFSHRIASATLDQIRTLAPKLGFHLSVESSSEDWSEVTFRRGSPRPRLVLAHSHSGPSFVSVASGAPKRAELRPV